MKTGILLNARIRPGNPTWLQHAPNRLLLQVQKTGGCNCDRWGHPCPGCVECTIQPEEVS
jgi:hypothetical protein